MWKYLSQLGGEVQGMLAFATFCLTNTASYYAYLNSVSKRDPLI